MHVLALSAAQVQRLIDPMACMDVLAKGFKALSAGQVKAPPRPQLDVADKGFGMAMMAWCPGQLMSLKAVNVFHDNHKRGLPSHMAVIQLCDAETGAPVAIMDGAVITGLRTAAAAMLSVRELARKNAKIATVIGGGVQGRDHARLLGLVRDLEEIRVASRRRESAERAVQGIPRARVVTDVAEAARSSDVVCLTTSSERPVIEASWVRPGTHVTSVGFAPPGGELPPELAKQATVYVETRNAFSAPPVGCAELRGIDPQRGVELGELLSGTKPGRTSDEQITVYKSMGNAMEDMVVANLVYEKARQQGIGQSIEL